MPGSITPPPTFRGLIEGSAWNPQKKSIAVNFNMGVDLREAIKRTTVNIIGEKGTYRLRLTTQYSSNNKTLLKSPRTVEKLIYVGTTPGGTTPGGGSDGKGDGEDNPLG